MDTVGGGARALVIICFSCAGGEQDPVTVVSQIEDRIVNNTAFKVSFVSFNTTVYILYIDE